LATLSGARLRNTYLIEFGRTDTGVIRRPPAAGFVVVSQPATSRLASPADIADGSAVRGHDLSCDQRRRDSARDIQEPQGRTQRGHHAAKRRRRHHPRCCPKRPQHIPAIQLGDPDIPAGTPQSQEVRDAPNIMVGRRSRQAALADTATVESLDQLFFVVRMTQSDPAAWSDHAQRRQMR